MPIARPEEAHGSVEATNKGANMIPTARQNLQSCTYKVSGFIGNVSFMSHLKNEFAPNPLSHTLLSTDLGILILLLWLIPADGWSGPEKE